MKKNIIQSLVLPFVLLFGISCDKEFESLHQEQSKAAIALKAKSAGGCRMTSYDYYDGIGDFHNIISFTYKNGLVDNVFAFGLRYDMEYDRQRKMIGLKAYDGETLVYIINFVYEKNKVAKEIWKDGATQDIVDEVFNTYSQQGNLTRNESFMNPYYTVYTYTANRSLESWQVFIGGLPVAKAEYTYNDNYKNPFASVTGIDYLFWSANSGFGVGIGHRWYSSEKVTLYDENGGPFIYYELYPAQTVWHVGQQHYPLKADYVDKSTHAPFINTFEYDCNPGQSSKAEGINQKMGTKHNSPVKRIKPYFMLPYKKAIEKHRGTKFH